MLSRQLVVEGRPRTLWREDRGVMSRVVRPSDEETFWRYRTLVGGG